MKLTLNYIDSFQYHGPYRTVMKLDEKDSLAFQQARDEDTLKNVLDTFLRGPNFLTHVKDNWKWPLLTQEEAGSSCDATPEDLIGSIHRWFERSFSYHTVEVLRAGEKNPNDITMYTVHEEVVDGLEDQHLFISIQHDGEANPQLKAEHIVPTEEERMAQREQEAWQDSLWDD